MSGLFWCVVLPWNFLNLSHTTISLWWFLTLPNWSFPSVWTLLKYRFNTVFCKSCSFFLSVSRFQILIIEDSPFRKARGPGSSCGSRSLKPEPGMAACPSHLHLLSPFFKKKSTFLFPSPFYITLLQNKNALSAPSFLVFNSPTFKWPHHRDVNNNVVIWNNFLQAPPQAWAKAPWDALPNFPSIFYL